MLVVDLMHKFELGVWKGTFMHIIQVLYAAVPGGGAVTELNRRCCFPRSEASSQLSSIKQVSSNSYIWIGYYSAFLEQRISNETTCCKGF